MPVLVADVKGDVSGLGAPGRAGRGGRAAHGRARAALRAGGLPGRAPVARRASGPACPCGRRSSDFGPQLLAKVLGPTRRRSRAWRWSSTTPTRAACRCSTWPTCARCSPSWTRTPARPSWRASAACRGRRSACCCARSSGWRRAAATSSSASRSSTSPTCCAPRPTAAGSSRCVELAAVQERPALWSTALMWIVAELFEALPEAGDLPQAQARRLPRRGAPALRRRDGGVPGGDRAHRAADPLQGRRRVLRHPAADGPPGRGARPARPARPARAARVHAGGRQGAAGDRVHLSRRRSSTTSRSC